MNAPQGITDREERARRLLTDCKEHLSRGDAAAAVHFLMRAVEELGDSCGHSTEALRAAVAQKLSSPQDINSLLSKLEISASQPSSAAPPGSQHPAGMSVESSRASSQQFFDLADARNAAHSQFAHMDTDATILPVSMGSESFQCPHCGGVFAVVRRQQHLSTWCPAASGVNRDTIIDSDSDDGMVT